LLTGHGCALLTGAAQGVASVSNASSCLKISGMITTFAFSIPVMTLTARPAALETVF
jgi:hypothetical protein